MEYKDRQTLQDAYQLIFEGKQPPCPCTMGKKCTKKGCECKACCKSLKESQEGGMPPTAGAASRAGANPGVNNAQGEPLDDQEMQEAMAILNQYAQGDITNLEAAKMIDDLYKKGAGHGPSQDDMHYTKLE